MLFDAKIRLKKAVLGQKPENMDGKSNRKILRLAKSKTGEWEWDLDAWADAIREAIRDLNLGCDPEDVHLPPSIRLGKVAFFRRLYRREGNPNMLAQEHESISKGYILTFKIRIKESGTLPTPNKEQLLQILNYIGEYEGISEWGRSRGFGRFEVESLNSVGRGYDCPSELPTGSDEDPPVSHKGNGEGARKGQGDDNPVQD